MPDCAIRRSANLRAPGLGSAVVDPPDSRRIVWQVQTGAEAELEDLSLDTGQSRLAKLLKLLAGQCLIHEARKDERRIKAHPDLLPRQVQ